MKSDIISMCAVVCSCVRVCVRYLELTTSSKSGPASTKVLPERNSRFSMLDRWSADAHMSDHTP